MDDFSRRSTADLVMDVATDVQMLVRKELELARIELMDGVKAQLRGAGIIAAAAIAALPGALFLVIALAEFLSEVLPIARSAGYGIVGGFLMILAVAGVAVGVGMMRRRKPSVSTAVESMKEDVKWARDRLTS